MGRKRVPLGNYVTEYSVRNKGDEDIPVYSVTNSQGFCTDYFDKEVASKDKKTYKIVPKGYFAYNPSRINVGSVDWQKYEERVIVSPLYNVFSVSENLEQQYLFYFLRSDIGKQMIKSKVSGSVRDNLKIDMLKEMTIPEMSIEEQKKFVHILDTLKIIISLRKKELDKLDTLIKARFVEMFGEGLKDDGKFKLKPISEIGQVVSGATPKTSRYEYWNGDNVWITPAELSDESFVIYDSERKLTYEGVDSCAVTLLPVGTVILSSRAPIGKVAIAGVEMYCNQGFKNIIPRNVVSSIYLYELLKMETEYLKSLGRGATFKEISKQIVENIRVKVPPIELQNQFATFVAQVNKSKVEVKRALDEAQLLFDSLMQKYFG